MKYRKEKRKIMKVKQYEAANVVKEVLKILSANCGCIDTAMSKLPSDTEKICIDIVTAGDPYTLSMDKELTQRVLESMYNTIDKRVIELNKKFSEL